MLLHYLGKLKNPKFYILMHAKHVSNVTFYHLSNRCLPNVVKISVKINTMQNTNIFRFVRSLSLTNWRNAYLRYGPISDRSLLTLQLTTAVKKVSPGLFPCKWWTFWTPFVNKPLQTVCICHVFLVQVAFIHRVSLLTVLMLDGQ